MLEDLLGGSITSVPGVLASGVAADIKVTGEPDVALIYATTPATAAGVFTTNRVQAAPVQVSRDHLAGGRAQAIVAVSGVANACTGEQGGRDAREMAEWTGKQLGLGPEMVVVASTGVIGVPLPMEKVRAGIQEAAAALAAEGGERAARAIMTTDTRPKTYAGRFSIAGRKITVGGIAKGSGMIHPNLATMLVFLATDAAITQPLLQAALRSAVTGTFNQLTVDGDTSTNDMVVVLATGQAGNAVIGEPGPDYMAFQEALTGTCLALTRLLAADGEGATKLIEVEVAGALSSEEARRAARAAAGSNLVKAAVFGADANWGRIICAVGAAGITLDPERVEIAIASRRGREELARGGIEVPFDAARARDILSDREIKIILDLGLGEGTGRAWGCDLTYEYVRINASYRS